MEQKHRAPGYYWVKVTANSEWAMAWYTTIWDKGDTSCTTAWVYNSAVMSDSDFHLINETRIPSPDEVVVIADETCEMTPEMWEKLAERVKNKAQ